MANHVFPGQLKMQEFHGRKGESWPLHILNWKLAYEVAGLDEATLDPRMRKAHMIVGLKGRARTFLDAHPNLREDACTYDQLIEALQNKFGRRSAGSLLHLSLIKQKPDESVSEYAARLLNAAEAANPPDIDFVIPAAAAAALADNQHFATASTAFVTQARNQKRITLKKLIYPYFLAGLQEQLQAVVRSSRIDDWDRAIQLAEEQEEYEYQYGASAMAMANLAISQSPVDQAAEQLKALNEQFQQKKKPTEDSNEKELSSDRPLRSRYPRRNDESPLRDANKLYKKRNEDSGYDEGNKPRYEAGRYNKRNSSASGGYYPPNSPYSKAVNVHPRNSHSNDNNGTSGQQRSDVSTSKQERCFFCARPGHRQRECRTRIRYFQQSMGDEAAGETTPVQRRMPNMRTQSVPNNTDQPRSFPVYAGIQSRNEREGIKNISKSKGNSQSKNGERPPYRGRQVNHLRTQFRPKW
jgi:hypothetical protein